MASHFLPRGDAGVTSGMVFPAGVPHGASGIYAITCLRNGKCYVGSAVNLRQRFATHLSDLKSGKHHGVRLRNAWKRHGAAAFLYEVLEVVTDKAALIRREQLHIDLLGAAGQWGYNTAPRAGSQAGLKMSAASRAKMKAAGKKRGLSETLRLAAAKSAASRKGQKLNPVSVEKMRAAKIGKPIHPITREALRIANTGHHRRHGPETRAKIAAKAEGRICPEVTRAAVSKATKGVKWTSERTAKRIATWQANRAASGVRATLAKWTPERTAKFIAAFAAKREAGWKKPRNGHKSIVEQSELDI